MCPVVPGAARRARWGRHPYEARITPVTATGRAFPATGDAPPAAPGPRRRARATVAAAAVIALAAAGLAISRLAASPGTGGPPAAARAGLPARSASCLGVDEALTPRLPAGHGLRPDRRAAAQRGRVLQRVGGALRCVVRGPGAPSSRGHARPDRPQLRAGRGDRRQLRQLPPLVRRQRPGLRPPGHHRFRARDERPLALLGLPATPAGHVSSPPGGTSCGSSGTGASAAAPRPRRPSGGEPAR